MSRVPTIFWGLTGSLRERFYNRALLRAAFDLVPADTRLDISIFEGGSRFFNQDWKIGAWKVKEIQGKNIERCRTDCNTWAWLSSDLECSECNWLGVRPYGDNSFDGKPAAIMSASTGMSGGARAQLFCAKLAYLNICTFETGRKYCHIRQPRIRCEKEALMMKKQKNIIERLLESSVIWTKN